MNDAMTIKGYKTTVTLAKDFTYNFYGVEHIVRKGTKFDTKGMRLDGIVMVLGHGNNEVIPHDYLGKYEATWKEVAKEGNTMTTIEKNEDVTAQWVNYWKEQTDKCNAARAKQERADNKRRIAELRKTIAFVKTGEAEAKLKELLAKI